MAKRNRVVITSTHEGKMLAVWGPLTPEEANAWRKYKLASTIWSATVKRLRRPNGRALNKARRTYAKNA